MQRFIVAAQGDEWRKKWADKTLLIEWINSYAQQNKPL